MSGAIIGVCCEVIGAGTAIYGATQSGKGDSSGGSSGGSSPITNINTGGGGGGYGANVNQTGMQGKTPGNLGGSMFGTEQRMPSTPQLSSFLSSNVIPEATTKPVTPVTNAGVPQLQTNPLTSGSAQGQQQLMHFLAQMQQQQGGV